MAQTVTVFGGSGFVGRHAVRALAKAGYRVRVAVRRPNLAQYLTVAGQVGQIELRKVNVHREAEVAAALRGADIAINCVGVLSEWGKQNFKLVHIQAAERIAKAAKMEGCGRLLQISAIGADPHGRSNYARSKGAAETCVLAAFAGATILRPSIVFGPEDDFFNRFAAMAETSPFLPLAGGGTARFQPVYVGDVAEAMVRCLARPDTAGKTYELGGPNIYSFKELLEYILVQVQRERLLLPVPLLLARLMGYVFQFLPKPLLTVDQVRLLKTDNVVSPGALSLADLGIVPDVLEAIVPAYLWRFRPHGQFAESPKV